MRRILARMIVAFSKFITCPLSPFRRASALAIACEGLYDEAPFVTEQAQIRFHASSRRGFDGGWSFGTSETDTLKWIDAMPEGSCFWDIGANIGVFSLCAAHGKKAHVLAFEPAGGSFFVLNTNIELNRMSDIITGYCMAFSDETKGDYGGELHSVRMPAVRCTGRSEDLRESGEHADQRSGSVESIGAFNGSWLR